MKNIGIIGGSFNPVHKGHLAIFKEAIKELNLDKLIVVPNYQNPFSKNRINIDPQHRIKMLELVIPDKAEICKFDVNRKGKSYTYETVKYLKSKYKSDNLFFIMGTDNLKKLQKWRNVEDLFSLAKLVVFKRNASFSKINIKRFNGKLMNNKIFDYSSTEFIWGSFNQIPLVVNKYIGENGLYVRDLATYMIGSKLFAHLVNVSDLAAKYARVTKLNAEKAWVAGFFHDITKNWSIDEHKEFMLRHTIKFNNVEQYEYHAITSSVWVSKLYLNTDSDIIESIRHHTTLSLDASLFSKVIYAADKLCKGRKFPNIQRIRDEILIDFDSGFKKLMIVQKQILIDKDIVLSKSAESIFAQYEN